VIESTHPELIKTIAIKNTWRSILAYFFPVCIYGGFAVWSGLTRVGYEQFLYLLAYIVVFVSIVATYIHRLKEFDYNDGLRILLIQVFNWYFCFGWWIFLLEQGRSGGLFFAMLIFIYTYAYTNIRKTIVGNFLVAAIYLGCSYYAVYHQHLSDNLFFDIYLLLAFLPVSIIIAKVGGELSSKKYQLKKFAKAQKKTQEQLQETLEKLEHIASTDDLTGLLNRREMNSRILYEFKRLKRTEFVMSVLILDLDFFKTINDKHGHMCGDVVLQEVARVLQQEFRETDSIARWGGEEFLVLMPATSLKQALKVSQRVLQKLGAEPIAFEQVELIVTASGGVCEIDKDSDIDVSIKHADDLLYKAKALGRNKVIAE